MVIVRIELRALVNQTRSRAMSVKKLWVLLPIACFWIFYAIGYIFIDPHPFAEWYGYPLLVTLMFSWMVSIRIAIDKLK